MDTIERINNENIRLHDEMKEIRHSLVNQIKYFFKYILFFLLENN